MWIQHVDPRDNQSHPERVNAMRMSTTRAELIEQLTDVVLFKTGLVLSEPELRAHLGDDWNELLAGDPAANVALRAEEYEELVHRALHELGHIETPTPVEPSIAMLLKYGKIPAKKAIVDAISDLFFANVKRAALSAPGQPIDLMPVLLEAKKRFGTQGLALALEWHDLIVASVQASPWSRMRRVDWLDDASLRDLFESAKLDTPHGTFFDQRYIDYLASQFDGAIDRIHWRKFEGLTCEYFERIGCRVEIGPGTNDDNVDARVWWPDTPKGAPATLLVQCKRERDTVGKLVVKALYADMVWEKASGGLVVTTQRLSRGADRTRTAREYPIGQADRDTLREWIQVMRSTGATR